jgi:hypothetical protein
MEKPVEKLWISFEEWKFEKEWLKGREKLFFRANPIAHELLHETIRKNIK